MSASEKPPVDFDTFWAIYCEAFPADERRSRESQEKVMAHERYSIIPLEHDGKTVGFITCWDLDHFMFGEHFAVDAEYRGSGIGEECLKRFLLSLSKPFIAEVEFQRDSFSARRIAFYERLGLKLNGYDYLQPPYEEDQKPVPMKIMSFPELLSPAEFEDTKASIHRIVYQHPA